MATTIQVKQYECYTCDAETHFNIDHTPIRCPKCGESTIGLSMVIGVDPNSPESYEADEWEQRGF